MEDIKNLREVFNTIKEGEIWTDKEDKNMKITKTDTGNILIEFANKSCELNPTIWFKLERKEVSFVEAYKALLDGKEIISKFSNLHYKRYLGKTTIYYSDVISEWRHKLIDKNEVEEGWYIIE